MKKYDLYWAKVQYEEVSNKYKNRPVLILEDDKVIPLSAKITSKEPRKGYNDYPIQDWKEAGLKLPSTLRLSHIQRSSIYRYIGHLSDEDIKNIESILGNKI